jgi:outer membrane protein assembly factor BamB
MDGFWLTFPTRLALVTKENLHMRYAFIVLVLAGAARAADWPQYLGPTRAGVSSETPLARQWGQDGPKVLWKKSVGSGWSAPVVVAEKLIIFHRVENEEVLECLEASSGKSHWKESYRTGYTDDFNFDDGPRGTPLVWKETIFTLGANGDLSAWKLSDGKRIWQRNINKDYEVEKAFFGVGTSPMIADGKLLINVGGKGAGVVAFDPANGKEVWKSSDDGVSYSSPVLATIDGEELAIFFTRKGLLALKPGTGKVVYSYPWRPRINASVNAASPIVHDNQIFISTSYNTGAVLLEASKGELKEIWKGDRSMSCHYNTPVLFKEHLFGLDGRQEGGQAQLRCVEWRTGKVIWKQPAFGCATLTLADGLILAMAETGTLILIEPTPDRFKELARAAILEKPVRAATALSDGRFFARDRGKLVCVEVK